MPAYASYVIRCWLKKDGATAFSVQHVQTGELARFADLKEAMDWISTHNLQIQATATSEQAGDPADQKDE